MGDRAPWDIVQAQLPTPSSAQTTRKPQPALRDGVLQSEAEYILHGGACDHTKPTSDCFFSEEKRKRAVIEFQSDVAFAAKAYSDAVGNARVEALLDKHSGWGVAGDLLYSSLAAALLFGAEALAVRVGLRIGAYVAEGGSITEAEAAAWGQSAKKRVSSLVRSTTSTARTALRSLVAGLPREAAAKVLFVSKLQNDSGLLFASLRDQILLGNDSDLVMGLVTLSPQRATVDYFRGEIENLFDRYQSLHLDEIGDHFRSDAKVGGSREAVWLTAFGKSRMAIVAFHETGIEQTKAGYSEGYKNRSYFVSWVDHQFEDAAVDAQTKRIGAVREIDVSVPQMSAYVFEDPTLEVEQWAHRCKVGGRP